jgi:hypothetical protein
VEAGAHSSLSHGSANRSRVISPLSTDCALYVIYFQELRRIPNIIQPCDSNTEEISVGGESQKCYELICSFRSCHCQVTDLPIGFDSSERELFIEKKYWLRREHSSVRMAREATSSRARLVNYQLAGLYAVKAAEAGGSSALTGRSDESRVLASTLASQPVNAAISDQVYYECLEQGARYLAEQATDPAERAEHLKASAGYAMRAFDAARSWQAHSVH